MAEAKNPYDQGSRFLMKRAALPMLIWMLRLTRNPDQLKLVLRKWEDARRITFPLGEDRTNDTVAIVSDEDDGGRPWAVAIEFQLDPDSDMLGRLLVYAGYLLLEFKPTDLPGDRYEIALVVINLRGHGDCSRTMRLAGSDAELTVKVCEWNLSELDAESIIAEYHRGEAPWPVLAWIPLMQGGNTPEMKTTWRAIVESLPDRRQRGDLVALARVYSGAVNQREQWRELTKGIDMIVSEQVEEWKDEGREQGRIELAQESLMRILRNRFGVIPLPIQRSIQAIADLDRLRMLSDEAFIDSTIEAFAMRLLP